MLVYGRNVVNEILNGKTKIYKVFLDNNYKDEDILNKIDKRGLKKFHIDKSKLDKMCGNFNNQGIAMDIEEYNYYDILNHYLRKNDVVIKNVSYGEKICINIIVEKRRETGVISEISDITNRTVISKNVDTYYYA